VPAGIAPHAPEIAAIICIAEIDRKAIEFDKRIPPPSMISAAAPMIVIAGAML
jgi:hypothetical protein